MTVVELLTEIEELDTYTDDNFVYLELQMYAFVVMQQIMRGNKKLKRVYTAIQKLCKKRALNFEGLFEDKFVELQSYL